MRTVYDDVTKALASQRASGVIADTAIEQFLQTGEVSVIESAFNELDAQVGAWLQVGGSAMHGMSLALYQVYKIWDKLPTEFTGKWKYDFWEYAMARAKVTQSTARNLVNVAKVWLSGEVVIPNKPESFNPFKVNHSNLLLATSVAKKGMLDEEGWAKLSEPTTSWDDMRSSVHSVKNVGKKEKQKKMKPFFTIEENLLTFNKDGSKIPLGEINVPEVVDFGERNEHELFEEGIKQLRLLLKIG